MRHWNREYPRGNWTEKIDEEQHGTMLASIAHGSEDLQAGFTGAAPYAELLVVKLKPAKPYLKDFLSIPEMPAYQKNDIMAAIEYLEETARKLGRPLILCLGLGTNNGSHLRWQQLELLDDIAADVAGAFVKLEMRRHIILREKCWKFNGCGRGECGTADAGILS